ncbi:MAG: prolipoprotein diacylglyceryl transferase [Nitrospirae bacterium]|nr:prolipoprotein diacylglyceryl transferase [Nitrospirota bacterium]
MNSFIDFWQHIPEHIKPYIFQVGQFQLRYYGLMYIVAFSVLYILSFHRLKTEDYDYPKPVLENYFVWAVLGLMLGARLGYVLFYNLGYYVSNPLEIFLPFSFSGGLHFTGLAGMSYHGGLIGVVVTGVIFCKKYKVEFWRFADFLIPSIPLGYTFGRIGNFINGELYGRATTVPWGMYFPLDSTQQLRHPSQLYEALLEGVLLFIVLWTLRKRKVFDGFFLSLYIMGYGMVRLFIEMFREPDAQIGYLFGVITLGQVLCLCMIFTGIGLYYFRKNKRPKTK